MTRAEYGKKWRAENAERVRADQKAYRLKNGDALRAKKRAKRLADPERAKAADRASYVRTGGKKRANMMASWQNNPAPYLIKSARKRARQRGVPFLLKGVRDVPTTNLCPLTGVPLKTNRGKVGPDSRTLDRIDSKGLYEPGNVMWISHRANTIKSNATADELIRIGLSLKALAPHVHGELHGKN